MKKIVYLITLIIFAAPLNSYIHHVYSCKTHKNQQSKCGHEHTNKHESKKEHKCSVCLLLDSNYFDNSIIIPHVKPTTFTLVTICSKSTLGYYYPDKDSRSPPA
ncbi:hypothetical protein [Candidatus Uabimicrobium sp. HlEnr_7]|uniref:hypothetical protein n=1 Tax=Candidatus Uabimicrobium helgolandensis TaxID=3095367 RepID=UPI00355615BD